MNFMNKWPRRLLAALVIFVLLAGLVQLNNVTKPELVNTDGRVFTKAVVTDILRDNIQENGSRIGDQIVALQLANGDQVTANCPNGLLFGTVCEPGISVVVIASKTGSLSSYTVYSYDRMTAVAGFLAFFALLLMVVGGKKGVKSVIALTETSASSSSPASSSRASARCSTSRWMSRQLSRRLRRHAPPPPGSFSRAACASARMSWARWRRRSYSPSSAARSAPGCSTTSTTCHSCS